MLSPARGADMEIKGKGMVKMPKLLCFAASLTLVAFSCALAQVSTTSPNGQGVPTTGIFCNDGLGNAQVCTFGGVGFAPSGVAAISGTFLATGHSAAFMPLTGRSFNLAVWSSGASGTQPGQSLGGTVYLARSIDGGATYTPVTGAGTQLETFSATAGETWMESQNGVTYELICSGYNSGTINYRFSQ